MILGEPRFFRKSEVSPNPLLEKISACIEATRWVAPILVSPWEEGNPSSILAICASGVNIRR
jgi:hypothetical protein